MIFLDGVRLALDQLPCSADTFVRLAAASGKSVVQRTSGLPDLALTFAVKALCHPAAADTIPTAVNTDGDGLRVSVALEFERTSHLARHVLANERMGRVSRERPARAARAHRRVHRRSRRGARGRVDVRRRTFTTVRYRDDRVVDSINVRPGTRQVRLSTDFHFHFQFDKPRDGA